ncbi:MAG: hypothetical protein LBS03_10795 [Bacteroidales bacterium]|jgi:hypothetical protein|nr:hypothetical protein [Bacteroidales bacterium]
MKKLIFTGLAGIVLYACQEKDFWDVEFIEPYMENGRTEVALYPELGFHTKGYNSTNDERYHFYCDTVHPPQQLLFSRRHHASGRVPFEKKLLPGRVYYWKCVVTEGKRHEKSSEIYSFTTGNLSLIEGKVWVLGEVVKFENYWISSGARIEYKDDFMMIGDITRFRPMGDSAFMVQRWKGRGGYLPIYPPQEPFKYTADSMYIGEKSFRLLNYGRDNLNAKNTYFIDLEIPFDRLIFRYEYPKK